MHVNQQLRNEANKKEANKIAADVESKRKRRTYHPYGAGADKDAHHRQDGKHACGAHIFTARERGRRRLRARRHIAHHTVAIDTLTRGGTTRAATVLER